MHKPSRTGSQPISHIPPRASFIHPKVIIDKGSSITVFLIIPAVFSYRIQIIKILKRQWAVYIKHPFVHVSGHNIQPEIVRRKFVYIGRNDLPIIGSTTGNTCIITSSSLEVSQEVSLSGN